jgi:branched-subunit amino acid ABC-type transport system permease component
MVGTSRIRIIGIAAAGVTVTGGLCASWLAADARYEEMAHNLFNVVSLAFAIWALCGLYLLALLARRLYTTRHARSTAANVGWALVLLWAPIVVPLIVGDGATLRTLGTGRELDTRRG